MEASGIEYKIDCEIPKEDLYQLYRNAGWTSYINDMDKLMRAFQNSDINVSAWDRKNLVGAARAISDGESIAYIQDILVHDEHRRKKIGTKLVEIILDRYKNVRQKVLITDLTEETNAFYKSLGFNLSTDLGISAFVKVE